MKVLHLPALGVGVRIASTGSYLPATVRSNDDVRALGAPFEAGEIERLTGIRERHIAAPHEATSDLALCAARQALVRAQMDASTLDRIVVATTSPDHPVPSTACFVQAALGCHESPAHDVSAACSGFLYALDVATRAVATGDTRALVVAADIRSRFVDVTDRSTAALFGDGAGAVVVERCEPGRGLIAICTVADGRGARSVHVPAGGSREPASLESVAARRHTLRMQDGPQVYLSAVEGMLEVGTRLLASLGLTFDDVDLVVPHQPNRRILERMARLGGIDIARVLMQVERTGNVSGASCAMALDEALVTQRVSTGARVLLLTAGAGYTAGAALLVVDDELVASVTRGMPT
jgi:3-oxoacyl-[acyl-carrier-protein] synthase-3